MEKQISILKYFQKSLFLKRHKYGRCFYNFCCKSTSNLEKYTWYWNSRHIFFKKIFTSLKLVSAIFCQIFIFSPYDNPSKTVKWFLFHLKGFFRSRDIQIFLIFPLPFHTFQIQKNKFKWNNLWCHELVWIKLQV